jgi:hypothetical protein
MMQLTFLIDSSFERYLVSGLASCERTSQPHMVFLFQPITCGSKDPLGQLIPPAMRKGRWIDDHEMINNNDRLHVHDLLVI